MGLGSAHRLELFRPGSWNQPPWAPSSRELAQPMGLDHPLSAVRPTGRWEHRQQGTPRAVVFAVVEYA